ncbi:hypothetical protein MKX03_007784 [Papaver bracteatum]|nr:hypothetical protein MKX03_007784 [Papaver bracteatum]
MEEEKQLDFNAPFLSVRRFSSSSSSSSQRNKSENHKKSSIPYPYYKPELKSGPIINAGAVPFMWEHTPGTPKDETNTNQGVFVSPEVRPAVAPKLPPGRVLEIKRREPPEKKEFIKEQLPRNEVVKVQSQMKKLVTSNRRNKLRGDNNASKLESLKDVPVMGKKGNSDSDGDGDDDDAFIDAQDTLSRSESFFFNCSVSGVSGLDGSADAKPPPSGTFATDLKTRDFMMGRFLPAAKAMASDTPQYAPRRQAVAVREPSPRQLPRALMNEENASNLLQITAYAEPKFAEDESEDESGEDGDDYSEAGDSLSKGCGLFPRLCLRSSACLLNPVPGMKVRSHAPLRSARQVGAWTRTEKSRLHVRSNDEKKLETVYKHKLITGLQQIDDENKLRHESNELVCWSGSQTTEGSYKNGLSGEGGISPYRNEATQSPFREGAGFLGVPNQVLNSKDTRFDPYMKDSLNKVVSHRGSGSMSPAAEKTLYIDSGLLLEAPVSNSSSSDYKDFKDNDSQIVVRSQGMEEISLAELFLQDNKDELDISRKGSVSEPKSSDFVSSELNFSTDKSNHEDNVEVLKKGDNADDEARFLVCSNVPTVGSFEFDKPEPVSAENEGNLSLVCFLGPLPPPLPKSPSESWLLRTLPSVSSRNAAQFSRKKPLQRFSNDPKWETIVKTSYVNNSNSRFSEGLKKPAMQ